MAVKSNGQPKIVMWPTTKPIGYARNARVIPDSAVGKVAASIKEFGFKQPIVVDAEGVIIAGHTRLLAAERLGLDVVPVLVADDLTPAQVKAYRLADNRTGQEATWDMELLGIELEDLAGLDIDLSLTGFDAEELLDLQGDAGREVVEDEVPEPPEEPITKPGDLWLLGEHRVLCGDATEREDYAALLNGNAPSLLVTDPPYGVAYQDAGKSRIQGDLTQAAFPIALACCTEVMDDNARFYVFCATDQITMADRVFSHHLGMRPRLLIWAKESFILRHNNYHSQYEVVCFGWKGAGGGPEFWYGDRKQSDLWTVGRDGDRVHPTQKPVEVCAKPIANSSAKGGVVLDPFLGSGTTLIAAEQTGRICYGMEIDPRYCDVIVTRWENLTGKKATLGT